MDRAGGSAEISTGTGSARVGIHAGTAAVLDVRSDSGRVQGALEATDVADKPAGTVQAGARTRHSAIGIRHATHRA